VDEVINVFRIHASVFVGPPGEGVPGRILRTTISPGGQCQYEVGWWNDRAWSTGWFDACLVRPAASEHAVQQIGFLP
jgi:hypothetical protein